MSHYTLFNKNYYKQKKAADDFCEEDIDRILSKRTQVVTLAGGEKGSTFAKATFSTEATRFVHDYCDLLTCAHSSICNFT